MNIQDVKIDYSEFERKDLWEVVFEKQKDLMSLYKVPVIDLDVPADQQLIRAMAWNIIEELGEALEVLRGSNHKEHLLDELADMTHFYVELLIMSNLSWRDVDGWISLAETPDTEKAVEEFLTSLALTVNILKNI